MKTTTELQADLRRLRNILGADRTGRTHELERGIGQLEIELDRRLILRAEAETDAATVEGLVPEALTQDGRETILRRASQLWDAVEYDPPEITCCDSARATGGAYHAPDCPERLKWISANHRAGI